MSNTVRAAFDVKFLEFNFVSTALNSNLNLPSFMFIDDDGDAIVRCIQFFARQVKVTNDGFI